MKGLQRGAASRKVPASSSSCPITVPDQSATLNETGSCEDGSDDNLILLYLAEAAVVKKIGRFQEIKPVSVQVALAIDTKTQTFNFSRVSKVSPLVFHLGASPLSLFNFSFLISDDDPACEYLLVGQPVLQYLGNDI